MIIYVPKNKFVSKKDIFLQINTESQVSIYEKVGHTQCGSYQECGH